MNLATSPNVVVKVRNCKSNAFWFSKFKNEFLTVRKCKERFYLVVDGKNTRNAFARRRRLFTEGKYYIHDLFFNMEVK